MNNYRCAAFIYSGMCLISLSGIERDHLLFQKRTNAYETDGFCAGKRFAFSKRITHDGLIGQYLKT